MKRSKFLFSFFNLIFIIALLFLGFFFLVIGFFPPFKMILLQNFYMLQNSSLILIGFLILILGSLLLKAFFSWHQGLFYRIQMKKGLLDVDLDLLKKMLLDLWKENEITDIDIDSLQLGRKQTLEIFVILSPVLSSPSFFQKIEKLTAECLKTSLHYIHPFLITFIQK